jgi:hypothetical protein
MLPVMRESTRRLLSIGAPIAILGMCLPPASRAQTPSSAAPALRVVWEKTYGSETLSTEFRASAPQINGLVVGVSERNAIDAKTATASRLLLWKIDAAGTLTSEVEIRKSPSSPSAGSTTAAIRDVTALDAGETLALVDFEAGRPSIVRIDRAGKQTLTKELVAPGRTVTLFKIVPAGRNFLLIGHENLDALLMQIDAAGTLLWEKKFDRGKMDFFVDGIAAADEGFVLVGNSGQYDPLRAGPSIVWVGRYGPDGQPSTEVTFPGRYGKIARSSRNVLGVVFDKSATNDQEIHLKGLDPDLKEKWETAVVKAAANFSDFKVAAAADGGFVTAGARSGRPYMAAVDAAGRVGATFEGDAAPRSLDVGSPGLVSDGTGGLYVSSSHIDVQNGTKVRQRVRVRKVVM